MKSQKLNQHTRESILRSVIRDAFKTTEEEIEVEREKLSEAIYNDVYDTQTQKKMNELPEGWLAKTQYFHVQFGSDSSGYCRRVFNEPKVALAKHLESSRQCIKIYDEDHKLSKWHKELTDKMKKMSDDYDKAHTQAAAIINSCNTTKQLKEAWAEIAPYVERYESQEDRKCTALAPITDELNLILGLKKQ